MGAAEGQRSLTDPESGGERRQGFHAIGLAVSKLAAPIIAKRSGGFLVRLKGDWSAIVGADWALAAWPAALGRDGVLKLRTAPAAALEVQHRAPLLIERINLYFGRTVVTRLVLVQTAPPLASSGNRAVPRFLAAEDADALERRLSGIASPELRAALARLGRSVMGADR